MQVPWAQGENQPPRSRAELQGAGPVPGKTTKRGGRKRWTPGPPITLTAGPVPHPPQGSF